MTTTTHPEAEIIVDTEVPLVRIVREFDAPAAKVYAGARRPGAVPAVGRARPPRAPTAHVWDARTGGSYRYTLTGGGDEQGVQRRLPRAARERADRADVLVGGHARRRRAREARVRGPAATGARVSPATSLVDSFADRDAFVASGMEDGRGRGLQQAGRPAPA